MSAQPDCIEFVGAKDRKGYGRKGSDGKTRQAHRIAWTERNGPIPDGLFVLHRCDNPPCINVDHLFLGTQLDNMQDMITKRREKAGLLAEEASTSGFCWRGHAYNETNTYWNAQGERNCRKCITIRKQQSRLRKREMTAP